MNTVGTALLLIITGTLAACGYNVQVVKDFHDGASDLSKSYNDILTLTEKWCAESMLYKELNSAGQYKNSETTTNNIKTECKKYADSVKVGRASSVVLMTYTDSLASLVDISPQYLSNDIKGVTDALGTIKNTNGDGRFKAGELDAFNKLASVMAEMVTSAAIKDKATEIMYEHTQTINEQVDLMRKIGRDAYEKTEWLNDVSRKNLVNSLERVGKMQQGDTSDQAITYRYLAYIVYQDTHDEKKSKAVLDAFDKAAEDFKTANSDLSVRFAKLSKKEKLDSVKALVDKAKELKEAVNNIK